MPRRSGKGFVWVGERGSLVAVLALSFPLILIPSAPGRDEESIRGEDLAVPHSSACDGVVKFEDVVPFCL